jgi:dephospho-CoA kinase
VIVVIAPLNARLLRIVSRDGISFEQAMQRNTAQHDDAFYIEQADFIVENSKPQADYSNLLSWLSSLE